RHWGSRGGAGGAPAGAAEASTRTPVSAAARASPLTSSSSARAQTVENERDDEVGDDARAEAVVGGQPAVRDLADQGGHAEGDHAGRGLDDQALALSGHDH